MSSGWREFALESDIPPEGRLVRVIAGWHVLVIKTDDGLHAINDRCTHQGSTLSPGRMRRGAIICPLHGAFFDVASGRCIGGTYPNVRTFPLQVVDGMISVTVPDELPSMEELPAPF